MSLFGKAQLGKCKRRRVQKERRCIGVGCEGGGPPLGVQGRQRGGSASGVQERGRGLKVHEGDTDRVRG